MRALVAALAVASVLAACSDVPTNPSAAPTDLILANQLYYPGPFTMVSASKDPAAADGFVCELVILAEDR